MNSYLKVALVCLLIGLSVTCLAFYANAKDATLEIEFQMDEAAAVTVVEYQLHVNKNPGELIITQVATMPVTDPTSRVWTADVFDIPPGRELAWYLHSVDASGEIGVSPAYMYKLIGNGIIINIRRIK